jgi:hypothetical protein
VAWLPRIQDGCCDGHAIACSRYAFAVSRRHSRPSFAKRPPSSYQRAQGRPGAGRAHGPRAEKKHAAEPQVWPNTPSLPCAMALRLIRDLLGDRLSCPRRPRARRTQAWHQHRDARTTRLRRTQHAIRPRSPELRCDTPRPPHSAPTSVTIAIRPSGGTERGYHNADFAKLSTGLRFSESLNRFGARHHGIA